MRSNKGWRSWTLGDLWQSFLDHCPVKVDLSALKNLLLFVSGAAESGLLALLPKDPIALLPPAPDRLDPSLPDMVTIDVVSPVPDAIVVPVEGRSGKPWQVRRAQVQTILAEAWAQGITTYSKLLALVKERTGKICSRRAIVQFKRSRGLL